MPPLRDDMPIRDPERAEREPQHSREYANGGWTKKPETPDKKR